MGFAGLNITYPCKQAVIPLLDELSDEARAMGAVNTVVFTATAGSIGHNTDGSGWAWGFRRALPEADLSIAWCCSAPAAPARRSPMRVLRLGTRQLAVVDSDAARAAELAAQLAALYGAERVDRRQRRRRGAGRRRRPGPRHAHRHGQAARPAAARRAAAARAVGCRRSSTSRSKRRCSRPRGASAAPPPTAATWRSARPSAPSSCSPAEQPDAARMDAHFRRLVTAARADRNDPESRMTDRYRPRSPRRRRQPAGHRGHRVHRVRHRQAAGAGPGARADGLQAGRAAPLARGAAVPPGRHERDRQRPCRQRPAPPRRRRRWRRLRCACATPPRPTRSVLDLGAWDVPVQVAPMELHIPAIHGVGASRIYFVDRHREFSIYDVDFVPIPGVDRAAARAGRPALVRRGAVHRHRPHGRLAAFLPRPCSAFACCPTSERFGILPRGPRAAKPLTGSFYLQLIEPDPVMVDRQRRAPAARGLRRARRAGRGAGAAARAASSSSRPRACTSSRAAR